MTYYSWWTASRLGRSSCCKHTHKTTPRIRGIRSTCLPCPNRLTKSHPLTISAASHCTQGFTRSHASLPHSKPQLGVVGGGGRSEVTVSQPVTQIAVTWNGTKNVSNTPAHIYFQNPPPTLHITKMRGGGGAGGGGGCVCVEGGEITGLQRQLQLIRNVRGLSQECRQGNHTIYGNRGRTNFYQWAERAWEWLNMQRLISHPWRCMACVS